MRHIYYICSHFTYLVLYDRMRLFFRRYYPDVRQSFILIDYPFLSLVDHEEFIQEYDAVHLVTYGETAFTTNWRKEYSPGGIKRRLRLLRDFFRDARKFAFEEGSLCFVSEMTEATPIVRLLIAKLTRETQNSILCRVGTCFHRTDECRTNNWLSWLENNLLVLIGAPPVSVKFYGWMLGERRFYSGHKIMDRHLVFSNRWADNKDFAEVRFPLLADKMASHLKRKRVIFMDHGTGWLSLFPEMSVDRYIVTTNRILKALTELYSDQDVDLVFKGHPRGYDIHYDLAGFKVYDKNVTAEMMFARESQSIMAVYSQVSTSARTASLFGIHSYIFDELYDLPEEQRNKNQRSLVDFGNVVNIRSLDELEVPGTSASQYYSTEEDLDRLADVFGEIISTGKTRK